MEEESSLNAEKQLIINGMVVSVLYFRAGYTPTDYPTEIEWQGRLKMERSSAIKCPSIAYHLVGTKKIQQELAVSGTLERFLTTEQAASLRPCFAGLYGLEQDHPDLQRVLQAVRDNPDHYVLKPQREGGGNNLYGDELISALDTLSPAELESYILMTCIQPTPHPSILVRNGQHQHASCIPELGLYVTSLITDTEEVFNTHIGHLLRTKSITTVDGGVNAGNAFLDTPYLI